MKMYRPHRLCPRNSKPKEPSLYRSLCVSILCMFLSTVMLVGTTMAWFSDSLKTGMYTISSANFTVTTYFCSDLAGENGNNNWQRLNPGNATMFGGGSLSSGSYQTAYLKIVNDSNIDLKYTLTITDGTSTGEASSTLPLSLAYKVVDDEAALKTAFTSPGESSTQNGENTFTDAGTPFTVPKATTKFVALKLSLNATPPDSTDQEQIAEQHKFGLRLEITQTDPNAQVTESNSPTTNTVLTTEIVNAPPTPVLTAPNVSDSSGEGAQQPSDENNSGTNNTETSTGSTTGTSESGDTDTTGTTSDTSGGNGDTTVTENGSET